MTMRIAVIKSKRASAQYGLKDFWLQNSVDMRLRQLLLIVLVWCFVASGLAVAQDVALPDVVDARVSTTSDRARLIVDLSAASDFAIATIADPDLIIAVDLKAARGAAQIEGLPSGSGLIRAFSVEEAEPGRVRFWLRLADSAKVQQAYMLEATGDQPARLVVDLIPAGADEFFAQADFDLKAASSASLPDAPQPNESASSTSSESVTKPQAPRALIVLDPGHGGVDGGATAPNGTKEKDIVLAFAKILQKLLVDTGRFDVALTRESDEFLKLEDRVALARQNKADLFISIHADSFQDDTIRGASIYTRDENATDVLDKVLADQENRVDLVAGFAVPKMEDRVVNILVDLMRREIRMQSFLAARSIVNQMAPSVRLRRFPLRRADFFVLQSPDVPSLLLELGFLSNTNDITNLTAASWRNKVAEALAKGIAGYFDELAQP